MVESKPSKFTLFFYVFTLSSEIKTWNYHQIKVHHHLNNHFLLPHPRNLNTLHQIDDFFKKEFDRMNLNMNPYQNLNLLAHCFLLFYLFYVFPFYLNLFLSFFFLYIHLFFKNFLSISYLLFAFFVFPHLLFALLSFFFFCVFLILYFVTNHHHSLYFS